MRPDCTLSHSSRAKCPVPPTLPLRASVPSKHLSTYFAHKYHRRRKKKALGRTLFSTVHGVLCNPHIRTYLPFLLSKQREPRCSFTAWLFPQVSICTESPAFHRGGFSGEIPRFRIGHRYIGLVFVVSHCALQLGATDKHVFRSGTLPSPMTFNGG